MRHYENLDGNENKNIENNSYNQQKMQHCTCVSNQLYTSQPLIPCKKIDVKSPNLKLYENKTPDSKSMLYVITQCFSVSSKSIFFITFGIFYSTAKSKVDSPAKLDSILYSRKLRKSRPVSCFKTRAVRKKRVGNVSLQYHRQ